MLLTIFCSIEKPTETTVWVIPSFKLLHWKGFFSADFPVEKKTCPVVWEQLQCFWRYWGVKVWFLTPSLHIFLDIQDLRVQYKNKSLDKIVLSDFGYSGLELLSSFFNSKKVPKKLNCQLTLADTKVKTCHHS